MISFIDRISKKKAALILALVCTYIMNFTGTHHMRDLTKANLAGITAIESIESHKEKQDEQKQTIHSLHRREQRQLRVLHESLKFNANVSNAIQMNNITRSHHNFTANRKSNETTKVNKHSILELKNETNEEEKESKEMDRISVSEREDYIMKVESTLSTNITREAPLLILNLPNSGEVALDRYFKCSGLEEDDELGLLFAKNDDKPRNQWNEVGKCFEDNWKKRGRQRHRKPLDECGNYRVWTRTDVLARFSPKSARRQCFYPVLQRDSLHWLLDSYPNATIMQVIRDPEEWYKSLNYDLKYIWPKFCNEKIGSENPFPEGNATKSDWIDFYIKHRDYLRSIVKEYPSLSYIEVDLNAPAKQTAQDLQSRLNIPETCWLDSAMKPNRPHDINLPIFVTSLPKSATSTTHDFLNCGLGRAQGAHQWTNQLHTGRPITVGNCISENIQKGRNLLYDCGDRSHWSDTGILSGGKCFYPTIHGGLQALYESYPYATILNVLRDPHAWYRSAKKWRNILQRWSDACPDFPPREATEQDWVEFYHWHSHTVRQFAKKHPTMTYVEVVVEANETASILHESFGFSSFCWGHHANVNKK